MDFEDYGFILNEINFNWEDDKIAREVYQYLCQGRAVPSDLEDRYFSSRSWDIPVLSLFCELDCVFSLDDVPKGIRLLADSGELYYYVKPRIFMRCVKLCISDTPATIVELFEYAMQKWGISLEKDFTVISYDKYLELLNKRAIFTGYITTSDIRRFIRRY